MSKKNTLLLTAGAALIALANLRWGVGILAWIAPVPLLHYLRINDGWRSRLPLVGALVLAWTVATFKIVSAPLPPVFGLLGVVFGLYQALAFVVADGLRRRLPPGAAVLAFPVVIAIAEWAQYRFTELASWTAVGYTQLDDLPLLQVASVAGLVGVGFAVNLVASSLEHAGSRLGGRPLATSLALVVALHGAGAARLAGSTRGTLRVAAVGTLATFGPDTDVSAAEREHLVATFIDDAGTAARSGAKLVVSTEGSMLVLPDEEPAVIARLGAAAASLRVDLVVAYVIPGTPRFANKLVWVRADGRVDHMYWKHHPAPGEPAVVGHEPLPVVVRDGVRLGAAICYDYDFPQLAAEHGARDVDVVALPASDWRGIDPIHTQMAAVRAVEQGISIVRSTRFGLSAGIDPHGRLRAWSSSFDAPDRVLVVDVPAHGTPTIYRRIGDSFVYACLALLVGAFAVGRLRRRR